jgi:glycosyltransferase involved in cell wall biosynthesis
LLLIVTIVMKYLKIAINSAMAQTYENWELIFWDNQSRDESANIVNHMMILELNTTMLLFILH